MQPSFSKNTFSGHTQTKLASGSLILPNSTETLPKDMFTQTCRNLIEKKSARIWQAVGEVLKQTMQSTTGSITYYQTSQTVEKIVSNFFT